MAHVATWQHTVGHVRQHTVGHVGCSNSVVAIKQVTIIQYMCVAWHGMTMLVFANTLWCLIDSCTLFDAASRLSNGTEDQLMVDVADLRPKHGRKRLKLF